MVLLTEIITTKVILDMSEISVQFSGVILETGATDDTWLFMPQTVLRQ